MSKYPATMFVLLFSVAAAHAEEVPSVETQRDIVYATVDGHELMLDLHVPVGKPDCPLIVWIHGGGWRGGSRTMPKLQELTKRGFALASISYRFSKVAIFPAQIHDCKAAIRWLRANADQYGYNAKWIGVAGSSAGGHLALLLGTSGGVKELEGIVGGNLEQSSSVQAVVNYYGPSDFVLRGKTQPERAYTNKAGSLALMGGSDGKRLDPKTEAFASPVTYVSADDPPLLIFHGKKDAIVLLDQSERIAKLYADNGLQAELVILDNGKHGGKAFFSGEHLDTASRFLTKQSQQ